MLRNKLWLCSFASLLLLDGCVTVPNLVACTAAGKLDDGMICAETNTGVTSDLTLSQTIDFLEPTAKEAGAVCFSASDFNRMKTALQQACKDSGKCKYEGKK